MMPSILATVSARPLSLRPFSVSMMVMSHSTGLHCYPSLRRSLMLNDFNALSPSSKATLATIALVVVCLFVAFMFALAPAFMLGLIIAGYIVFVLWLIWLFFRMVLFNA